MFDFIPPELGGFYLEKSEKNGTGFDVLVADEVLEKGDNESNLGDDYLRVNISEIVIPTIENDVVGEEFLRTVHNALIILAHGSTKTGSHRIFGFRSDQDGIDTSVVLDAFSVYYNIVLFSCNTRNLIIPPTHQKFIYPTSDTRFKRTLFREG